MKKILLINSLLALTLILVSCGQRPAGERAAVREKEAIAEAQGEIVAIDYANSRLAWIGYKPTGQHDGIISFSEGSLNVKNQTITGGEFVIDINSLKVVDIVDPEMNASLRGHLLSPDFFDVALFSTARFVISSVEEMVQAGSTHQITGNLTMKDVTKSVTFPAEIKFTDNRIEANSVAFTIDRAAWNIRYGSKTFFDNLRDNFINDEVTIKISIVANI